MQTVSVKLPDELVKKLDKTGNRSEAIRSVLSTATVVSEVPVKSSQDSTEDEPAGIEEMAWLPVDLADMSPESTAMSRFEMRAAMRQAGFVVDDFASGTAGTTFGEALLKSAAESHAMPVRASGNLLFAAQENAPNSQPPVLDPTMLALMQLSEFYMLTEGDIWQALVSVPLQIGMQDFTFPTGDSGAIREARQYLEDELGMHERLEEIWVAENMYGNAYPLDVYDGKRLSGIVVPNSKHIAIAPQGGIGQRPYYLTPPPGSLEAIVKAPPSFVYNEKGKDWNERDYSGIVGIQLDPTAVTHFRSIKASNHIYGVPPLARAIRAIDSRRFLEEMTRATIEGVRNQFWVFTLENPRKGEVAHLTSAISGSRGSRTGFLVWSSNLDVKQFIPQSIDQLLANETYRRFTLDVYRRIGISIRMVSGESPDDTSRGDSAIDVDVFLSRLRYTRRAYRRYLQKRVDMIVGTTPSGDPKARVDLEDVEIEVEKHIKNQLVPLLNYGIPSLRTAFTKAGLDADAEMAQHKEDKAFREEYIHPYSGFGQDGPSGRAESVAGRRPVGSLDSAPRKEPDPTAVASASAPNSLLASTQSEYASEVQAAWQNLLAAEGDRDQAVRDFIGYLLALNTRYRQMAYAEGYAYGGGHRGIDEELMMAVVAWDSANADDFEAAMLARLAEGGMLDGFGHRAMLYPAMGWKQAYMGGLWQAKQEEGWTGWRRILRPYASQSGPCSVCRADATQIHSMQEPWWDHPSGVCGMQFVQFYHSATPGGVVRIPTLEDMAF